jgi:hypothetical protein
VRVSFVAIMLGAFGVYAGWRWKLLHRAVQDVVRYKSSVRSAQKTAGEQLGGAVLVGIAAIVILVVVAKLH